MKGRIDSLQALRAIAAILVMLFHMGEFLPDLLGIEFAGNWFRHGEAGVDIFFVLSGFIIYYSVMRRPEMTRTDFFIARFIRLYPIYWIVIAALVFAEVLSLSGGNPQRLDPSVILRSLLLMPSPDYVLGIAWTLVIEVLFYLMFALFFFSSRKAYFIAMAVWSGLAVTTRIFPIEGVPYWLSGYVLYSGIIEFAFGTFAAWLCMSGKARGGGVALMLGIVGFTLGLADLGPLVGLGREFTYGVPALFMIYGAYAASPRVPRWLVEIGDASYILYLVHGTVLSIVFRIVLRFGDTTGQTTGAAPTARHPAQQAQTQQG